MNTQHKSESQVQVRGKKKKEKKKLGTEIKQCCAAVPDCAAEKKAGMEIIDPEHCWWSPATFMLVEVR